MKNVTFNKLNETPLALIDAVSNAIADDLINSNTEKRNELLTKLFKAKNEYENDERDGIDYIYDIKNSEDLRLLLKNDFLTAKEISVIWVAYSNGAYTPYFYFEYDYSNMTTKANIVQIKTLDDLCNILLGNIENVVKCIIAYPYAYKSYEDLYVEYVTNIILDDNF